MEFKHRSVLLDETIENLNIKPDGIYVDGTLGGAGHSSHIVERLTEGGRLIGIDQDADAIKAASERLKPYADRVTIVRDNYCNFVKVLDDLGIDKVDGILLDIGVSSYQLDNEERGFSYRNDAPLDMRTKPGGFFDTHVPQKEKLDVISYRSVSLGMMFLTVTIGIGGVWAENAWGSYWSWDPKETWALVTWVIYLVYLHLRIRKGWSGRTAALFGVAGFVCVLFTYIGVNTLLPGLHSYK